MMYGIAGRAPSTINEMRVTTPHFNATASSPTTNPNSSNIIMFTKAWLFVAQRSAMRLESSMLNPFFRQMSMISFFQSFRRCSTSCNSLSSSDLMQAISARADRQSPRPIPMPSPTIAEMHTPRMRLGVFPEATPVRMMMRVLMEPSRPPQTKDLSNSPTSI